MRLPFPKIAWTRMPPKTIFLDIAMCVGDIRTGDVLLNDVDKDW